MHIFVSFEHLLAVDMFRFVLQNASRLVPSITVDVVDKYVFVYVCLVDQANCFWCWHRRAGVKETAPVPCEVRWWMREG